MQRSCVERLISENLQAKKWSFALLRADIILRHFWKQSYQSVDAGAGAACGSGFRYNHFSHEFFSLLHMSNPTVSLQRQPWANLGTDAGIWVHSQLLITGRSNIKIP